MPVIALVGRPNVGKSTLFNRLTRARDALVANVPGLTRDRQHGRAELGGRRFTVIDTGGLGGDAEGVEARMQAQARRAVEEADAVVFLVDARDGPSAADEVLAEELRRTGKPVHLAVNKSEGLAAEAAAAEFHALGLGPPAAISATRGSGVEALFAAVLADLPEAASAAEVEAETGGIAVAVVGRPNVGKSTLVNRLLGEERMLVHDAPGTTRDAVRVPFERGGQRFTLIDTAGVRRRARVRETVEKFSVVKTLEAIDQASVVILVLDAREGVTDQDAHLAGHALAAGRAMVVAVNKWDGLSPDQRAAARASLDRHLPFLGFARRHFISALHGTGVGHLLEAVTAAHAAAYRELPTPELNDVLAEAVAAHAPPLARGRRIKLRYAHQGGRNPPVIVVHGTQTARLPAAYQRYLENTFRRAFDLEGTPVRVELRSGENPYAGRPNPLTPRQRRKRQRLMRHAKGRKR